MGQKASKDKPTDLNLRIVRTYFDTPRKRAVLEIRTEHNNMLIKNEGYIYFVTIKDRGLRTLDYGAYNYTDVMKKINEWMRDYTCTVHQYDGQLKNRCNSAAF